MTQKREFEHNFTDEQIRQFYAESVGILFGGVLTAEPYQISDDARAQIDLMVTQIANCTKHLTELSFNLIFSAATGVVAPKLLDAMAGSKWLTSDKWWNPTLEFLLRLAYQYEPRGIVHEKNGTTKLLLDWVQKLQGNRMHFLCLQTARLQYRSSIQLALMGL